MTNHAYDILLLTPSFVLAYLSHRHNDELCLRLWSSLLYAISQHPDSAPTAFGPLLDAVQQGVLQSNLKPGADELDTLALNIFSDPLSDATQVSLLRGLVKSPSEFFHLPIYPFLQRHLLVVLFLSENGFRALLQDLIFAFNSHVELVLHDPTGSQLNFDVTMDLFHTIFEKQPSPLSAVDVNIMLLPNVVLFGYLLPISYGSQYAQDHTSYAQSLWASWSGQAPPDVKSRIVINIQDALRDIIYDTEIQPRYG
jgi:E3 ubiquitin-protein ligase listerin